METLQTDLYQLPVRHWSEIRRFLKDWAEINYLTFKDYRPFTHVTEVMGNTPDDGHPYYALILHRQKGISPTPREARTEPIVWIHKDSKLLRSL